MRAISSIRSISLSRSSNLDEGISTVITLPLLIIRFPNPSKERISHRKGWIAYSSRPKGAVTLDDGAVKAITERGKSLLPTGIVAIEGNFEVGDSVNCLSADGRRVAKGLVNYSSSDMKKIMRRKTSEIEKVLGYKYSDEAIHRDNLVVL